jgi:DNA-binding HxlR family transcriptional regulator
MLAEDTFQAINSPVTAGCQRASGLRFADPRVQRLWHAIMLFCLLSDGFRCADLRRHLASLTGCLPDDISQATITYQLRRLRVHRIIERLPHGFCYRVTQFGFRAALFFTHLYSRLLRPGLATILLGPPPMSRAFAEHSTTSMSTSTLGSNLLNLLHENLTHLPALPGLKLS